MAGAGDHSIHTVRSGACIEAVNSLRGGETGE